MIARRIICDSGWEFMKHFKHAIWLSLKYKWTIAGSVLTSLAIAALFCISITTVFPIVKIVLEGVTGPVWVAQEIDFARSEIVKSEQAVQLAQQQLQDKIDAVEKDRLESIVSFNESRIKAETQALDRYLYLQPWIDRFAPDTPFKTLVATMVFLFVTALLKGVMLVLSAICVARVSSRTIWDMRRIYYRKALELDQKQIEKMGTSAMITHLSNNMNMVSGGLRVLYGKSLREPFKMLSCLVGAAMISLPLLLISMVVIPAGVIVVNGISRRMKKSVQSELGGIQEVFQTLIESLSWLKTVRVFNRESTERKRFKQNAGVMYNMSMRISMYDSLLRPITEVLGIVAISLSILAGSYLVLNQATTLWGIQILSRPLKPDMLILFYALLAGASDPARKMTEIVNVLVRGDTACQNLKKAYDAGSKISDTVGTVAVPFHSQSVEFRDVSFFYTKEQPVLTELSLKVPFGQAIAIVGGNGCGKSTLMNLLARFYDPQHGNILLDGKSIRQMNPKRLRRQIAWVTQQSILFRGTVAENIAYGRKSASRTDIVEAARLAHVTDFLPKLENGLDTHVGDNGTQLSAGQRQRVALARAILADPRILILDEATSQMDGHTEQMVHDSLKRFLKDRTTFIVTHRASSLRLADRIIVMDNGMIVHDDNVSNTRKQSEHFQYLFAKSA